MRRTLAIVPGLVGLLVLIAWYFDFESIERLGLASVSMNPATAVCFVLLSVAMTIESRAPQGSAESNLAVALYLVVVGVALLKLLDVFVGTSLGIDTTLFASKLEASRWQPNRMAPNTAVCLLLISGAALLVTRQKFEAAISGQILAIATGSIALFALVGYLFGVTALYAVPAFIPMAAHTGVCFLMLAGAVLAVAPERGVMAPIADAGVAGRSARALLPAVLVVPLALGWLRYEGERAGLYPSEVGVALMITATVLLLAGLVWWNSRHLLAVDRLRAAAEGALRTLNDELEARVKQRTAEIEQREHFLSALLENMQDPMIVNRGGQIVFTNDACVKQLGARDASQILGRSPLDFLHPDYHAESRARVKALTSGESRVPMTEGKVIRFDGKVLDVEVTSASFIEGSEPVILSILRDVTARKVMEKQLQHTQRLDAVGQLTGGVAHDFNNLLAVIIGNLDLLEGELADLPRARALSEMALKASVRGAELTRQLLAFSRRQSLEPKTIDVNALGNETTALLRRTIGEKVEISVQLSNDLWPALADPAQTESALTNLAINARDAMPEGGRLTLETGNVHLDEQYAAENVDVTPGDYVMVAVTDTGTGIPPEILNKVFEPFFTTKADGKGTGLGLSMIYGFAKQSRGHVKIYSEVGHGTTVRLYLPKSEATSGAAIQETSDVAAAAPRGTIVLVVEDNPDVRRTAAGQLTQMGYQVVEAENAPAALQVLQSDQAIDLLFTDIVMPGGMTGIELAAEAPKLRPGLRVLLTTGFAEAAMSGTRDKSVPLLSKPYRKQDLANKIREVLDGPRREL